jgi:hypothetical protein
VKSIGDPRTDVVIQFGREGCERVISEIWYEPARKRSQGYRLPSRAGSFVLVGLLLVPYLAGYLFLWSIHLPPLTVTPLTILRYAHYYGDRPAIRRRLLISCGVSAGCALSSFYINGLGLLENPCHLYGTSKFGGSRRLAEVGVKA